MLRWRSLIWKRAPFGVGLLLATAACSTSGSLDDRCDFAAVTPTNLEDPQPDQPCEIVLTNGSRTLRVEVAGVAACDAGVCDAACSSPDLQLEFPLCYRGGKPNDPIVVTPDGPSGAAIGPFLGATPRNPWAWAAITCGGRSVWSGQVGVCGVAM